MDIFWCVCVCVCVKPFDVPLVYSICLFGRYLGKRAILYRTWSTLLSLQNTQNTENSLAFFVGQKNWVIRLFGGRVNVILSITSELACKLIGHESKTWFDFAWLDFKSKSD